MEIFLVFISIHVNSACDALLTSSAVGNRRPFKRRASLGNRMKSQGPRPGEYEGYGKTVLFVLARKSVTRRDRCAGALLCKSNHYCSVHNFSLFFRIDSSKQRSMYPSHISQLILLFTLLFEACSTAETFSMLSTVRETQNVRHLRHFPCLL
ncbi:hypothetical protein TNCV_4350291 [Trichonephila clavipes]|nr:hypothetical protein TNCV_4350291 [Trichonephila clavipes]